MTPPDPKPTAPPTVASLRIPVLPAHGAIVPATDEEISGWLCGGRDGGCEDWPECEYCRMVARIEADRAEMAEDAALIVRQNATIAGLSARVAELEEVLKAAIGHCDCLDYNGKALIPCTEPNPCVGCSMAAQIRAALKPEPR